MPASVLPDGTDGDLLTRQWARVRARLQDEIGEVEYRHWLRQAVLHGLDGDEVTVMLPTRFLRDWVNKEYGALLTVLWQSENKSVRRVDIRTRPAGNASAAPDLAEPLPVLAHGKTTARRDAEDRSETAAPLDPRFTFETFVVGKPNEFAYACARRVADGHAAPGFNPLFLYGGVGLGKTHLMHAIAWELSHREGRDVVVAYMSAEKFMHRFISALRRQSTIEFKNELRSVDVLMIDDLQFLIGKDGTQEEFFHTFNALVDAGKQIIVSADKSPSDLSGIEDRLRTRLGCGMVADVHATTYELRLAILEAKAARAGVPVPGRVMEFLAQKITSNVRELEGALNRLVAHAHLFERPVTLETAHEVLHDVLRAYDRKITIEEIQKRVAEHYNIRVSEMSSARRARNIARPRQIAMYLAKQLTSRSLPEIGRKFGNRDHTTVMHAVAKVNQLIGADPGFAEDVELLRRTLMI
ncbi:chromosomal replication initiator protein DnaA [Acidiphilium sp. AL]|uniref:Chromosomal replication initiator protein DnaA n=1 Tax=Acidiphilium iwatense TaxID=768198 RepID=A0ABS9DXD2_9PROT|nr:MULTISPECIES: chromosomal replication initiator protein DnaA [Acidiphilium]MCF3947401.1 chromosomal replication initiator protein DnaA [Acidiphilium iwatense]MCU4161712.1 chromosomal replication initiator protein DnaA [Acidiphilium sp. AL]